MTTLQPVPRKKPLNSTTFSSFGTPVEAKYERESVANWAFSNDAVVIIYD